VCVPIDPASAAPNERAGFIEPPDEETNKQKG
jgi:hypothetical protein